jgi:glutamate dehydrogenase (NAD(P)+)
MGTNAQTMAWMMDAYGQKYGYTPGVVTGKPVELGGSPGREEATGRGVVICTGAASKRSDVTFDGASIVVQGYGNVGYWTAQLAEADGAKIVAVSDVAGGIYNPKGLTLKELNDHRKDGAPLSEFSGGDAVTNEELLELECDILIPAAIQGVIHSGNADNIKTKLLVEAANGPTTPVADLALREKGITIVPDILANCGGVTVSYFEWVQNIQQFRWDLDQVNSELEKRMVRATDQVYTRAQQEGTVLRDAAFDIAVERVSHAAHVRGYV